MAVRIPKEINTDYDVVKAFQAVEDELISSMMRNLDHHRAEELKEGFNWSQWQVEQLAALDEYKKRNLKKYQGIFGNINSKIDAIISMQRAAGNAGQEISILKAIKEGAKLDRAKKQISAAGMFFKANDNKINALIKATKNDFERGEIAILRRANDQYRKIIFNAQIYASAGASYEQAVDMASKNFLSAGINCIEYKNGARHTMSEYADMALRTAQKRAYLTGEGEKRMEWGISTVIMNKRGNPCPKCLPFVGKVLIDDVWSGGSSRDGPYPLMSMAIKKGLYHPRCKDSHTTYFPEISTADDTWTEEELEEIGQENRRDIKQQYAKRQAEKFARLAKYSLDEENKKKYKAKAKEWEEKIRDDSAIKDRFGLFTNNNRNNPGYYIYEHKNIDTIEMELSQLEYEVGVIFDNGKAISCQLGIDDEVRFTKYQLKLMKGRDVTHNHPLSTPPSPEDLYLLKNTKAKSFRTCGKNGTYVLEYSEEVEKLPDFEEFSDKYDNILKMLKPKYQKEVNNGVSQEKALIKLGEEIWCELFKEYGIIPKFERR